MPQLRRNIEVAKLINLLNTANNKINGRTVLVLLTFTIIVLPNHKITSKSITKEITIITSKLYMPIVTFLVNDIKQLNLKETLTRHCKRARSRHHSCGVDCVDIAGNHNAVDGRQSLLAVPSDKSALYRLCRNQ